MQQYPFVLVNVFAETHFGGNPLAVFPDAQGLSDAEMQQIAAQFNLSETVFVLPSATDHCAACLRIFTPSYELPLAGHPTLGAAWVLQRQKGWPEHFVLRTPAKPVDIQMTEGKVYLRLSGYTGQRSPAGIDELAAATGIAAEHLAEAAYWINSGSPQLLLQVRSLTALHDAQPDRNRLAGVCGHDAPRTVIYLWHDDGTTVHSRLFAEQKNSLVEDSGTGSATANLGAYFALQQQHPLQRVIHQGDHLNRPNRLYLHVDSAGDIHVGGRVIEVGHGILTLP